MITGWIKLHRALLENSLWNACSSDQKVLMITILLKANHEPASWIWKCKKMEVQKGQFITSLPSLEMATGLKTQVIRTALKKFKKFHFLTDESTSTGRLISIINWDSYQGDQQDANRQSNSQLTDGQQTPNRRLTANKNDKNNKNENNDKNTKKNIKKKTPPPIDFIIDADILKIASEEKIPDSEIKHHIDKCFDHFRGKGQDMVNWKSVVKNWLRNNKNFVKPTTQYQKQIPKTKEQPKEIDFNCLDMDRKFNRTLNLSSYIDQCLFNNLGDQKKRIINQTKQYLKTENNEKNAVGMFSNILKNL